jgi:hypothetical protein
MSWLLRNGDVLAAIDGDGRAWAGTIQGAVVRRGPVLPHTLTCGSARDLAWCVPGTTESGEPCLEVRRITSLRPRRLGLPPLHRGTLVVAEHGAFERWRLHVGDRLEIRDT